VFSFTCFFSPHVGCCHLHRSSPLSITQPECWYLLYHPMGVDGWVNLDTAVRVCSPCPRPYITVVFLGVSMITYWSQGVVSLPHKCQPSLLSAEQYPSYGDCLEVAREYNQNCSVLVCVTQCSQSAAHSCEQYLQVQQIGFVTLGPLCHA